ncbi:hypothetical protein MKK88_17680 [Methylobacterium sp. E-005]|uniref:hypothetical protein n=1 Tax=Methylobacterium sp. E-005 TaxID=2836549 RepID=UPI001FBA5440|nr:hypothetical protein [Methylobacterium sp. E-005]MCJ2087797.1 hypothetical protein [Methylobacterium sp. E-005]
MRPLGSLRADLFCIQEFVNNNIALFEMYDCLSAHLAESLEIIYDIECEEFRDDVIDALGFEFGPEIIWHLNVTRLDVASGHRGNRVGVRALGLLRRFVQREGLIVTLKAFPDAKGHPGAAAIRKLSRYYVGSGELGLVEAGKPSGGWLTGNWSLR